MNKLIILNCSQDNQQSYTNIISLKKQLNTTYRMYQFNHEKMYTDRAHEKC